MKLVRQSMAWVLSWALLVSTAASAASPQTSSAQGQSTQDADLTPKELDNLVAPIALYPDALVAQILAAATYPDQITAANDWLMANALAAVLEASSGDILSSGDPVGDKRESARHLSVHDIGLRAAVGICYPADYRSSGVMTFLIDQNGVIYEKDLGPTTTDVATTVTTFNPDKTWTEVPGDEAQSDAE
ncbi:MAG: DUF2950 family protein [Candidatus Sulfotelmatobacter sp.]